MAKKLSTKLVFSFLGVTLLGVFLAGIIVNWALSLQFENYVRINERNRHRQIAEAIEAIYSEAKSWTAVNLELMHLSMMNDADVRISDPSGKIVAGSSGHGGAMGSMMGLGGEIDPEAGEGYTTKIPIRSGDNMVGIASITSRGRVGLWSPEDISFRRTVNLSVLAAALAGTAMALLLGWGLSERLTRPIVRLTYAAKGLGSGNLKNRVRVRSDDELGELARTFNWMADRLEGLEMLRKKLTADIAHELRTPIATLRSYVEAFQDRVMAPNAETLGTVHEEVMRLVKLVDDLQAVAVAEEGQLPLKRTETDLVALAARAVEKMQPLFDRKGIDLVFAPPAPPHDGHNPRAAGSGQGAPRPSFKVMGDPDALDRVLQNLLSNAWKYTRSGGEVTVELGRGEGMALVKVRDSGIGISARDLPYIFERFYRADHSRARDTGGTGIGLTIARDLAQAHGGRIDVESAPGKGSTFTVALPLLGSGRQAQSLATS